MLDHWISFADGLSLPPQEFYAALEKELANRKIPGLDLSRIEYAEGGLLSDKRIYLRMLRERLAFDVCAAPFGSTFFFSCRSVHSPPIVRLWHILAAALFFGVIYRLLSWHLGWLYAVIVLLALLLAILATFRNAAGFPDLDALLMKIPALGPIYEYWFRKETYYREDTRLLYLKLVPDIVKQIAGEMTGEKGIKLTQQYERAPILGELYKPVVPKTP